MHSDTQIDDGGDITFKLNHHTAAIIVALNIVMGTAFYGMQSPVLLISTGITLLIGANKNDRAWAFCMVMGFITGVLFFGPLVKAINTQSFYHEPVTIESIIQNVSTPPKMANIAELASTGNGSVEDICNGFTSSRGHITISYSSHINETVCCLNSSDGAYVPYRDDSDGRHYLCGNWPILDDVTGPLPTI